MTAVSTKTPLTGRQRQTIEYVGMGKTNWEIGKILGISGLTVKNVVQNILKKLGVPNRTAAYRMALIKGVIELPTDPKAIPVPPTSRYDVKVVPAVVMLRLGEDVEIFDNGEVSVKGQKIVVSALNRNLLMCFVKGSLERVWTRNQLIDTVWGPNMVFESRVVDTHIRFVRRILEPTSYCIKSVRDCDGYKLVKK